MVTRCLDSLEAYVRSLEAKDPELASQAGWPGLEAVAKVGDRPGWAFSYGFTVYWYATRGMAKRAWYDCQRSASEQDRIGGSCGGGAALGGKPEPCSFREAWLWAGSNGPSGQAY